MRYQHTSQLLASRLVSKGVDHRFRSRFVRDFEGFASQLCKGRIVGGNSGVVIREVGKEGSLLAKGVASSTTPLAPEDGKPSSSIITQRALISSHVPVDR